ncbi:hypothetical protein A6R68_15657 [Neotoma lepida]|uniref:Thyroxine-binding globulin n=1 Tax=Neotoma lepida TaxID=56216 RepID=A0A1A6H675_NEOLE|nr:hypothetical protein A6R68_15657 [Neotoma lepida]
MCYHLHSRMSVFLYLFLLVLGLQATIHCAQYNSSEGKVTTCHLPQQNATLYKMSSINADFAFSLYRRFSVENPDWNIFFSPVSISAALAMLSFGSGSSTQTQILEVLGFNLTDTPMTEFHESFQHLICSLNFPKNELELQVGNAVFIGQQVKPLAKFLDDVKTLYETEVFPTNFSNLSAVQQEINSYVEKQTKGKIIGLIQDLRLNIIMILVNYIHFKAQWANPFCVSKTEESSNFSVDNTTTVQVPMMHQLEQYYHFVDAELNCTVLQMDYSENALALFVLPKEGHMELVEAAMSSKTLKKWNRLLQKGFPFLPHMTLEAFHKAVLHIGEEGTKEGAALETVSLDQPEVAPIHRIIRFDRTFLLMILERRTRSILFLGKVVNPAKE